MINDEHLIIVYIGERTAASRACDTVSETVLLVHVITSIVIVHYVTVFKKTSSENVEQYSL